MLVCLLNSLSGMEPPWLPHHFTTQGPGSHSPPVAKPTKELGCQPGLGALGSEGIGDFVHFGLFLASSRHLRSSLGTWQRSLKNELSLPVETQACSRLLVFSDILRRKTSTKTVEKGWGWLSVGFQVSTLYHSAPFPFSSSSHQDSCLLAIKIAVFQFCSESVVKKSSSSRSLVCIWTGQNNGSKKICMPGYIYCIALGFSNLVWFFLHWTVYSGLYQLQLQ